MADEVLGITGVVNLDDIKNSFDGLLSSLEHVGAKTDELSDRMTKALSDIASSNGGDKASKAMEVLRQVIAEANKELGETPLMIANASKEVSNIEKAIAKLEEKQNKSIVGSKDFDSINKQLENERQALQYAKEDIKDLTDSQAAAQQSVSGLLELYGKLAGNIDTATIAKESINEATENEKRSIKELRDEYKQYQKDIQEINNELEKLNAERTKQQNKVIRYQSKSDALAANGATKGGYDSQSADYRNSLKELDKAKKKLEEMDMVQVRLNSDLEQYTKEAENVKDAIDNYGNAAKTKTPTTEYRTLRNEIIALSMEYKNMSDVERSSAAGLEMKQKLDDLKDKAAELKLQMSATNKELKNTASPTMMFQGASQGLSMLISGFATAEGAASALGLSEKDLAEVQTILQSSLAANNFLTETRTALLKSSALMLTINTVQEWASQKAIDAETAAKGRGTIATVALTVAQKAFNLVAKANPYVLLATALLTVVGAVAGLTIAYRNNNKAAEEAQKAAEERKAKLEAEKTANEQFASTMAKAASEQIVSYQKLRREWTSLGNDSNARKKFINDNQDAFHKLGYSVNGVTDAENLLVKNTNSVVQAIVLRAKAAAYEQRITDLTKEKIEKKELAEKQPHITYKAGQSVLKNTIKDYGLVSTDYTYTAGGTAGFYTLTESGAEKINNRNDIDKEYDTKINNNVKELTSLEKKLSDTVAKTGVKSYTPTNKNSRLTNNTPSKDNDNSDVIKAQEELNKELASLRRKNENDEIENLKESREKRLREIKQEHKEELEEVVAQAEKITKLNKESGAKNATESVTIGNKSIDGLTKEQSDELGKSVSNAEIKYNKSVQDVYKQEAESMRNYLKEYGTIQERRVALIQEWDKKIADAQSEGERLTARQQKAQAVRDFDNEQMKSGVDWEMMFGDVSNMSVQQLQAVKGQLKEKLSDGSLSVEDYKTIVEQIDKINDALVEAQSNQSIFFGMATDHAKERKKLEMEVAEAIEQQVNAQNELNNAQASQNLAKFGLNERLKQYGMGDMAKDDISAADAQPIIQAATTKFGADSVEVKALQAAFDALTDSTQDVTEAQDKLTSATEKTKNAQGKENSNNKNWQKKVSDFKESFDKVAQNFSSFPELTKALGIDEDSGIGRAAKGMADAANSASSAIGDIASGNYISAAANSMKALDSLTVGFGIGGDTDKTLAEDIERLNEENSNLADAIDRLTDVMEDASYLKSQEIYEQQQAMLAQEEKNTKEEMQRSAAVKDKTTWFHNGTASSNYYVNQGMTDEDWRKVSEAAGKTITSSSQFFDLSSQEMYDVATKAAEQYEKIKGLADDGYKDAAQFMDTYIGYVDEANDLADSLKEKFTSISFDSAKSEMESLIQDLDSSFSDAADNIETYLRNAIVSALMSDKYSALLEDWYSNFSDAMSDSNLTSAEAEDLKQQYLSIYGSMRDEVNTMLEAAGLDSVASGQSASYGESSNITQDQASEILGRITAVQWNTEQRLQYAIQQTTLMTTVQLDTAQIRLTQETIRGYVSELVDIQQDSLSNLQKIVINTNPLPEMKGVLDDIYKKIKNL